MRYRNKIIHYVSLIMRYSTLKYILICIMAFQLLGCMTVDYKMDRSNGDVRITPPTKAEQSKYHLVRVQDAWKVVYFVGLAPFTPFDLNKMAMGGYVYKNNPGKYPVRGVKLASGKTLLDVAIMMFTASIIVPRTVTYDAYILEPKSSERDAGINKKRDAVQKTRGYIL